VIRLQGALSVVQIPGEARVFFSKKVQTGSGACPTTYSVHTGGISAMDTAARTLN